MTKNSAEYDKFDSAMGKLLSVTHEQLKAKLEAEKKTKRRKPKKASVKGDK